MSEIVSLAAEKRDSVGTSSAKRLRAAGKTPGTIYGRDADPLAFAADHDLVDRIIRSGAKVVEIAIGGQTETAVVKDVHWNTWNTDILHFDLLRVDPHERVTVDVPIEFRGVAPGVVAGGHLEQPLHALHVECLAIKIPDHITVRIGALEIGDVVHVGDLKLDEGIVIHNPADAIIVKVVGVGIEEIDLETAGGPAEPEVIGAKKEKE